jgi:hypothetical protein
MIQKGTGFYLNELRILHFLIEINYRILQIILKLELEVHLHQIIRAVPVPLLRAVVLTVPYRTGTYVQYTLNDFWIGTVGFRYLS